MKQQELRRSLFCAFLGLGLACSASAALVAVNSTETWDGVANPHASDGVTLSGSGAEASPRTYTIPSGPILVIDDINFHNATNSPLVSEGQVHSAGGTATSAGASLTVIDLPPTKLRFEAAPAGQVSLYWSGGGADRRKQSFLPSEMAGLTKLSCTK